MSRFQRWLPEVLGLGLLLGLSAPAAQAQRCPFQMQMWYQMQMQQWAYQRTLPAQTVQPGAMLPMGNTIAPARPVQWTNWNLSANLQPRIGLVQAVHPSLTVQVQPLPLLPHPGNCLGSQPVHVLTQLRANVVTRPTLQVGLTTELHRLNSAQIVGPARLVSGPRIVNPTPNRVAPSIQVSGATPVFQGGFRFTCAGSCHAPKNPPDQPLRAQPQQPPDVLMVRLLPRPAPALVRVAPPPDLLLVNLLQPLRQPLRVPPARVAQADVPLALRALGQPPPVALLLRLPAPPDAERAGRPAPGKSLWSPEQPPADPLARARSAGNPTDADLERVMKAPPPAADLMARLPGAAPPVRAAPEPGTDTPAQAPASLDALLQSTPPPPTVDALLPPPPAKEPPPTERGTRVASASSDLDAVLESPRRSPGTEQQLRCQSPTAPLRGVP
jgi:hypothetical protein